MKPASGQKLVERYRKNYWLPADLPLTEAQCRRHWDLERALREELLSSNPQERREIFSRCYQRLYCELPWLHAGQGAPPPSALLAWRELLGEPPRRIYEVGSGRGALIRYLAEQGYQCRGSEITEERGAQHVLPHANLSWGATDGVNLGAFEPAETYDTVISDQVLEHLHPDDLTAHLRGVFQILKWGGSYLCRTPSYYAGPTDISRVFQAKSLQGMHLKEYGYDELRAAALRAGFSRVRAVLHVPDKLPWIGSRARLSWTCTSLNCLINRLPPLVGRMLVHARLLPGNVWIAAFKELSHRSSHQVSAKVF